MVEDKPKAQKLIQGPDGVYYPDESAQATWDEAQRQASYLEGELAGMSRFEYAKHRRNGAKTLGVPVSALDKEVERLRPDRG